MGGAYGGEPHRRALGTLHRPSNVYGAERDQVHPMYFENRHLDTIDFVRDAFRDDLTVSGGLLADECAGLYVGPDEDVPKNEQFNR